MIDDLDVLVSDIAMPEEDGYGLIAKVRSLDIDGQSSIPRSCYNCLRERGRSAAGIGFGLSDLT